MSQAKTREQYTKAWNAHLNELDVALCWDLMDHQTAEESAELQNALKVYRKYIAKAGDVLFPSERTCPRTCWHRRSDPCARCR
jgi:hypothetical protein